MSASGINLLQQKQPQVADKLLYFILHYFRYIIVITQIVVISVFFYRFQEDQKIIDSKEAFKQKQHILLLTLPVIEEAKALESQTSKINTLLKSQNDSVDNLGFIATIIPRDVAVERIQISGSTIQIVGRTNNLISIRSLHKKIKNTKGYENAQISSIQQNIDSSYSFGIGVVIATQNGK